MCSLKRLKQVVVEQALAHDPMIPSKASRSEAEFFYTHRIGRGTGSGEDQMAFIGNNPLDDLSLAELHGLSHRGREIDIPLFAALALDELNFSWESHGP